LQKRRSEKYLEVKKIKIREWRKNNPEKSKLMTERSRLKNPEKWKARELIRNFTREGISEKNRIIRPNKCQSCDKECKPEAHHEDYSKPFEVQWLCKSCHSKTYRKYKE
jgi:hypothetical protein